MGLHRISTFSIDRRTHGMPIPLEARHTAISAQENRMSESVEQRITRLVLEYAQNVPQDGQAHPLEPRLSLRKDLEIESLSLVSVAIRLGEEFDVDLVEAGVDLE